MGDLGRGEKVDWGVAIISNRFSFFTFLFPRILFYIQFVMLESNHHFFLLFLSPPPSLSLFLIATLLL